MLYHTLRMASGSHVQSHRLCVKHIWTSCSTFCEPFCPMLVICWNLCLRHVCLARLQSAIDDNQVVGSSNHTHRKIESSQRLGKRAGQQERSTSDRCICLSPLCSTFFCMIWYVTAGAICAGSCSVAGDGHLQSLSKRAMPLPTVCLAHLIHMPSSSHLAVEEVMTTCCLWSIE